MMGSNDRPQDELFYSFNLDDVVPENHLLRQIDRFLDFSDLRDIWHGITATPADPRWILSS